MAPILSVKMLQGIFKNVAFCNYQRSFNSYHRITEKKNTTKSMESHNDRYETLMIPNGDQPQNISVCMQTVFSNKEVILTSCHT